MNIKILTRSDASAARRPALARSLLGILVISLSLLTGMAAPSPSGMDPILPATPTHAAPDGTSAGNGSYAPSFTADSKHLLFLSTANNLVTNDNRTPWMDVFLQTIDSAQIVLVSANRTGIGGGNGNSSSPSASADGRFVAFVSDATDLTDDPQPSRLPQIYVRDLLTGATRLASRSRSGGGGNGPSRAPQLSEDGRYLVFESDASDLVDGDENKSKDVFVRDLQENRLFAISVRRDGTGTANGPSGSAHLSADGQFIVFQSVAVNLVDAAVSDLARSEVYVRDLAKAQTLRISQPTVPESAESSPALRGAAVEPQISRGGRYVAYQVISKKGFALAVVLHDRQQPNRYWLHRWQPLEVNFTRTPLQLHEPELALLCEVSVPFFPLRPQDQVILRFHPTDQPSCPPSGLGSPADRFVDSLPLAAEPPLELLCLQAEPLAEIENGAIIRNNFRPSSSADGFTIASALSLQPGNNPYFTPDQLSLYPGLDGLESLEGVLIKNLKTRQQQALPLFASMDSLAISPDGQWLAYDSPVPDRSGQDLNGASDVFLLRIGSEMPELITKRRREQPAELTGLSRRLAQRRLWGYDFSIGRDDRDQNARLHLNLRSLATDGGRIILKSVFPVSGPNSSENTPPPPFWDLAAYEQFPARALPITPYTLPQRARSDASDPTRVSNIVSQFSLGSSGRYLTVVMNSSEPGMPLPPSESPKLWSYDLETATRVLVFPSTILEDSLPTEGSSRAAFSTDRDGRMIVFPTESGRLVPEDFDNTPDLFLISRDDVAAPIRLTQPTLPNQPSLRGESYNPFLSPDGNWVAFTSLAADLVSKPLPNRTKRLWLQNIKSRERFIILDPLPESTPDVLELVWSEDSTFFVVRTAGGVSQIVDAQTRSLRRLGTDLEDLQLSANGRYLAAQTLPSGLPPRSQIIRMDLRTGERRVASLAVDGTTHGAGYSQYPQISPDGQWVYFSSDASNLVADDSNARTDVFAHDFDSGRTLLLSRSALTGKPGNGASSRPLLSANGNALFFQSTASDLIANDFDGREGLFQIRFGPVDSDQDGLPDEWEKRYFSDLSVANATTDSDGDGILDAVELELGLNPANSGSQAQIFPSSFDAAAGFRFSWTAGPWGGYVVQYADSLVSPEWRNLGNPFPMFQTSGTGIDTNAVASSGRYYRIQRSP